MTAMAYTILKLHATKLLKFKDMDTITDYLQVRFEISIRDICFVTLSFRVQYKLHKNFGYSDNFVIKSLETSLVELRAKRMDLPPPAGENELPKCEMGLFIEPTIEKKLGLRSSCFTDSERNVTEFVISRHEENGNDVDALDENQDDAISNFNTGMSHSEMWKCIEDFSMSHALTLYCAIY